MQGTLVQFLGQEDPLDKGKSNLCVEHNKLWKILKDMGIPDHLTCLLRNLCAGQEEQSGLHMEQQTDSK